MALKSIWSAKGYIFIGLISYVIFVVLTAPLEFIWPKIQPKLGPLPVQVQSITGSFWQGQAQIQAPQVGKVSANWDVQVSDLFTGQLTVLLTATLILLSHEFAAVAPGSVKVLPTSMVIGLSPNRVITAVVSSIIIIVPVSST